MIDYQDPVYDIGEDGESWLIAGVWQPSNPPTDLLTVHFRKQGVESEYEHATMSIKGWVQGVWEVDEHMDSHLVDNPNGSWYTVVTAT